MSAAIFRDALEGFRRGYAEVGRKRFRVTIFVVGSSQGGHCPTDPNWATPVPWDREKDKLLTEVRIPFTDDTDNVDNFTLDGTAVITHWPHDTTANMQNRQYAELCERFLRLCCQAGAALPQPIRKRLAGYCDWQCRQNPASWWIALLAYAKRFRQINVHGAREDVFPIADPWLLSIELIEVLKLETDSPVWPGVSESPPAAKDEDDRFAKYQDPLTPLGKRILKSLWSRKYAVQFDTLRTEAWQGKSIEDGSIERRLDDIKKRWDDAKLHDVDLEISPASTSVKLLKLWLQNE